MTIRMMCAVHAIVFHLVAPMVLGTPIKRGAIFLDDVALKFEFPWFAGVGLIRAKVVIAARLSAWIIFIGRGYFDLFVGIRFRRRGIFLRRGG